MSRRYHLDREGWPIGIWRCRCGAMLSNPLAALRHMYGKTICQHRAEGMAFYARHNRLKAEEAAERIRKDRK